MRQDALDEIARQRPRDLFKPLRVHFIGEAGIDAGGLKKEFFQLLLAELLCPDYGMLLFQPVSSILKLLLFRSRSSVASLFCAVLGDSTFGNRSSSAHSTHADNKIWVYPGDPEQ